MKKFEYKSVHFNRSNKSMWKGHVVDTTQLDILLNEMGVKGWELTTAIEDFNLEANVSLVLVFKKEIIE